MYLTDYHLHTRRSPDGFESIEAMCERAIELGFDEIAITDHLDLVTHSVYTVDFDAAAAHEDITRAQEKFAGRLHIMRGVEIGQPQANPKEYRRYMDTYSHDFIIGSIHNLKNDADVYYFNYRELDCNKIYDQYVQEMLELARDYDFDVMGHLTYPLRYMYRDGKMVDLTRWEGEFRQLFRILVQSGRGIEVNTSGLRQEIGQTLPPLYLLKLYKECDGEIITLGSDAHKCKDLGCGIREGRELLKEAGFTHFTVFEQRKIHFLPL